MRQAMVLVAARQGVEDVLDDRLGAEIEAVLDGLGAGDRAAVLMRQVPDDPFRAMYPLPRGFDAVLQFSIDGVPDERVIGSFAGLGERLGDVIHTDLSGVVVGDAHTEVGPADSDSRYLYPWRHKAGRPLDECQAYWRDHHAEFGRRLPGILGYDQFHTDAPTSKAAARAADLAVWQVAGMVVLYLPSVQEFIDAVVGTEISTDALEDELTFMDTANGAGEAVAVVRRWPG
jgi:hypothetical protein